jgi:hypothetical protein
MNRLVGFAQGKADSVEISLILFFLLFVSPILFSGGVAEAAPPQTVQPLPSDAPAPWGTDPAILQGVQIQDSIKGNGFLQETVTLPDGNSFFYQSIATPGFSVESYVKRGSGLVNDPEGNLVFSQHLTDPEAGLSEHTAIHGFKQPIQIHFDLVESKVAQLTGGLNQLDMHFRQIPFLDAAAGRIRIRQDIAVWTTSFTGIMPEDLTGRETFTLREQDLFHETARTTDRVVSRFNPPGTIDFWGDLEMVKITDAATGQLVDFSRCSDFGDPTRRIDGREGRFQNSAGTRGGCSGGTGFPATTRPEIPDHEADDFQLTPLTWERWAGAPPFSSGILTTFPRKR